jgi:hypothetical protein
MRSKAFKLSIFDANSVVLLSATDLSVHFLEGISNMLLYVAVFFLAIAEATSSLYHLPYRSSAGCRKALPEGQAIGRVSLVTLSSCGQHREYLISVPPSYKPDIPTPAILSYHGGNRNASDQLQLDQLTDPEFNTVSFVIYPQGINVWTLLHF